MSVLPFASDLSEAASGIIVACLTKGAHKLAIAMAVAVAPARNHRNLPIEILAVFSQDTVHPFVVAT